MSQKIVANNKANFLDEILTQNQLDMGDTESKHGLHRIAPVTPRFIRLTIMKNFLPQYIVVVKTIIPTNEGFQITPAGLELNPRRGPAA
jgi:hypothetical protein